VRLSADKIYNALTVQVAERMECMDDVFSLYFDIAEALWDDLECERTVHISPPPCNPKMRRDLMFELEAQKRGLTWTDGCRDLVSGWSRRTALEFLREDSWGFRNDVIEHICSIHGIARFTKHPEPERCYK
jgi:hypothetical protein